MRTSFALIGLAAFALCSPAAHAQDATIEGGVTSAAGDIVAGATVTASLVRFHNGRQMVTSTMTATADDKGRYRFDHAIAGRYLLNALPPAIESTRPTSIANVAMFGEYQTESRLITLEQAAHAFADLTTRRVAEGRISGHILDLNGNPRTDALFIFPSRRSGEIGLPLRGAQIDPNGQYQFAHVPPGEWVVQTIHPRHNPWTEGEFAGAYVTVNGNDIAGVDLRWTRGSTIGGKLVIGDDEPTPEGRFEVFPAPANLDESPIIQTELAHAEVKEDNTFELGGIHGARRLLLSRAPTGWILKQVLVNGNDVTDQAIDFGTERESIDDVRLVVTHRASAIDGQLTDKPSATVSVVVFPVNRELWYPGSRFLRRIVADDKGAFRIESLPPGTYYVSASPAPAGAISVGDDEWQEPESLEKVAATAQRLALVPGERRSVRLPSNR